METKTMSEIYNFSLFSVLSLREVEGGDINYVAYTDLTCTVLESSSITPLPFPIPFLRVSLSQSPSRCIHRTVRLDSRQRALTRRYELV